MKLYVGNLPFRMSTQQIKQEIEKIFRRYGMNEAEIQEDRMTGRPRGFVFVDMPDEAKALAAIKECDGRVTIGGRIISVSQAREKGSEVAKKQFIQNIAESGGYKKSKDSDRTTNLDRNQVISPYAFVVRDTKKATPEQKHDQLLTHCYDVAFEIMWKTVTPTSANPCTDPEVLAECPKNERNEYKGFNRRWLMIGDRLAISPFTVKSAIANGFANLLGGCYRVNNKKERVENPKPGQYPYPGEYKRYRVARDKSKPGRVIDIVWMDDGNKVFHIMPVEEYYCNESVPSSLKLGQSADVVVVENRGSKPPIVRLAKAGDKSSFQLRYGGWYACGMDLKDPHPHHMHRFYKDNALKSHKVTIKAINFDIRSDLSEKVYVGNWFEDLNKVNVGDIIYYDDFPKGEIDNVGRNFLFKALFLHGDTVPTGASACNNLENLCRRCAMFGIAAGDGEESAGVVGFKGRFKASALVTDPVSLDEIKVKRNIPYFKGDGENSETVTLSEWKTGGKSLLRQFLLPIEGSPKPNKRDVKDGAYFNRDTGLMEGAKHYLHGYRDLTGLEELEKYIAQINANKTLTKEKDAFKYAHHLRNYAQVCERDIGFHGVIGAENCSSEEIAALVVLLDSTVAHHGFKIGLGKAFGLGTIQSAITKIWVRKPTDYGTWIPLDVAVSIRGPALKQLDALIPGLSEKITNLVKNSFGKINSMEGSSARRLGYPDSERLQEYWTTFRSRSIQRG